MYFHKLELETFCHATEDICKVKKAMLCLLPFEVKKKRLSEMKLEGSFGNEIVIIGLELDKQNEINALLKHIKDGLCDKDLDIDSHITDDRMFWMRLDKQAAYRGEIRLGKEDTIQLKGKVAAFPAKREVAVSMMRGLWVQVEPQNTR